jgi:hypothetical protein
LFFGGGCAGRSTFASPLLAVGEEQPLIRIRRFTPKFSSLAVCLPFS